MTKSLSVWRVWIEIMLSKKSSTPSTSSLSVWRVWIEMRQKVKFLVLNLGHSLYGECGLKFFFIMDYFFELTSLSVWRVWIEINKN